MFTISWSRKADKFLDKIPRETAKRIIAKVSLLQDNPFAYLEEHRGNDCYKLRVGDYRALVDVNFRDKALTIRVLDHRRRVYKQKV